MRNRGFKIYCLVLVGVILALAAEPLWSRTSIIDDAVFDEFDEDCPEGEYFTVVDEESGEEVFHTARLVHVGDMYQTMDNRMYEVISIDGFTGKANFLGIEDIEEPSAWFPAFLEAWGSAGFMPLFPHAQAQGANDVKISLYHTHSDESYLPTDGASSIRDNGGIYRVGESFAEALQNNGVQIEQSKKSHDPHDKKAYARSRRTAQQQLRQQNPNAILDIHRDALERRFYTTQIDGKDIAQIQLVVGRQNPNMRTNKQFAQELKAAADKAQPGLLKGIFYGRGSYNQDLSPRALLLEVGTHKNTRAEAKDGAKEFAKVVAAYLGASAPNSAAGFAREGTAARSSLFFLLALLVIGGLGYLFLSTGSIEEMGKKLRQFVSAEFSSSIGADDEKSTDSTEVPSKKRGNSEQEVKSQVDDDQETHDPLS
ncbi:MAG: stage II sporulation protein P [Bacillota bacterium]|nr:MAG: stage II sporulation protein P [Bacillota bacterium]MBS3950077.1 stage II sporulation protein P [Peptococcaceae bacterium]